MYLALKFVHVLLAITAVGANLTYGVWFYRANAQPEFATVALRGIRFIDDYIANPAYLLLLPTGAAMVWVSGLGFHTLWIEWAMGLWLVAIALAYAGYSPALAKQIAVVVESGPSNPQAVKFALRANVFAGVIGVIVVAILALMIFKPT
jgi:uncharacterized membrane protein